MKSRRDFLKLMGAGAVYSAVNCSLRADPGSRARPNVILCMADDQGWREMGYNRHPHLKTPVFDEAAWMDNQYKLVTDAKKTELFDIVADPLEAQDLAADKPQIVAKMKAQLEDWQASVERSLAGQDYQ